MNYINSKVFLLFLVLMLVVISLVGCSSYSNSVNTINNIENINRLDTNFIDIVSEEQITEQKESLQDEAKIEMLFMGDVMMDSFIADYINDYGVDYPWTDVSTLLNDADISVVNLETSVSNIGNTKKPEGYGFRSAPGTLQGLKNSGIDLVSLANNHVMDFGIDAFFDTLKYLNDYNIKYVGAGRNISEAKQLVIIEESGIKVGFLSFSSIIPWETWRASEATPGVASFSPEDYENVLQTINLANSSVDILTIIVHWGTEYQTIPNDWQVNMAHKMIDNGADLIVGHHPHVLQGIEIYREKPILYSIGNFIFLKKDDEAGKTGIFKLVYDKNGFIEGSIYPVYIKYTKANLLKEDDIMKEEIITNLTNLSKTFNTTIDNSGTFSLSPSN